MNIREKCPRCRHPEAKRDAAPDGRPRYTCTRCGWWWTNGVQESPEQRKLNNKIDAWHNGAGDGKPLHEFLGMTREEFARRVAGAHGVEGHKP